MHVYIYMRIDIHERICECVVVLACGGGDGGSGGGRGLLAAPRSIPLTNAHSTI